MLLSFFTNVSFKSFEAVGLSLTEIFISVEFSDFTSKLIESLKK